MSKVKITDLTNLATPDGADVMEIVDDVAGTPTSKKVTVSALLALVAASPTIFDATVGVTGADYTTVKAAVDAGKVNLLIIDDTTETADIAVPSTGLSIYIKEGVKIGMATFVFTFAGNYDLTITGKGEIETAYVGTAAILFNTLATTGTITLDGITIDNGTANTTDSYINGTSNTLKVSNVKVLLGTSYNCGFRLNTADSFIKNVWIVGGGVDNDKVITSYSSGAVVDGLTLTGSFRAGGYVLSGKANWNNITENASTGMRLGIGGQINNIIGLSGQACSLYLNTGTDIVVNNVNIPTGNLLVTDDSIQISNTICLSLDATSGEPADCKYNNVEIRGNAVIEGNANHLTNCRIEGNLTIQSGGAVADDYNRVENCYITGNLVISGGIYHSVSNSYVGGTLAVTEGLTLSGMRIIGAATFAAQSCKVSNCHFHSTVTVSSGVNVFSNCKFNGTLDINSYDCSFINCQGGTVNIGSSATSTYIGGTELTGILTIAGDRARIVGCLLSEGTSCVVIEATADATIISNCHVNVAPTDGGTNSVIDYVLY